MRLGIKAAAIFVAVVLVAGAWQCAASFLFLAMTGLSGQVEPAWSAWWLYMSSDYHDKWTKLYLAAAAAPPTIVIFGVVSVAIRIAYLRGSRRRTTLQRGQMMTPIERGSSDNHGHAEWMDHKQAHKVFTGPRQPYGGVVVGVDNQGYLLIDPCDMVGGSGHSMQVAGSGGFKTSAAVSSAVAWRGSSVVLDPSCELGPMLASHMRDSGKRVEIINLNRPPGAERWGVNVLDWIDINHPEAPLHVHTVVGWIFREEDLARNTNPFFPVAARQLVACLLAHLLWQPDGTTPKTLASLRHALSYPEPEMRDLLETIYRTSPSHMARQSAGNLKGIVAETFSGVYGNATTATSWLSVPAFAEIVSGDAFKTADLMDGRLTVFIQIPLDSLIHTPSVGCTLIGAMLNSVIMADGRKPGHRVLFLLDEVARLGKMKVLETARDVGRKYGIVLHLLWQSVGQMDSVWTPAGSRAWFEAMSWYSFSAVQTLQTAKEVSEMVGKIAVKAWSVGDNSGMQASWQPGRGSRSRGKQLNEHEIGRSLILPSEVLTDMPLDEMIVFARGQKPLWIKKAVWFRIPQIAARVEQNRFAVVAA